MAQVQWIFLDNNGGRHRVGLYHGDQSGHVMIHCNLMITQVDFSVKESKTYTFFIEDELIEIRVHKEADGHFSYEFYVNKEAETPLNQARKIENRRTFKQLMALIVLLITFIGLALWLGHCLTERRNERWSRMHHYQQKE